MKHAEFVHLHVHSEYSLLDGAAQIENLVAKAKELRFPAIALTDHGNLFGAIDFYLAARKAGVKPIVGCELYVAPGGRFEKANVDGSYEGANHCTVLVRNHQGYKNLIKLVSKGFLEGFYYKPRVDKELLAQHADGLLVLSGCLNSEVSRLLSQGDEAAAKEVAGWFQEAFGRDYYFMEVQSHGLPEQKKVMEGAIRIAKTLDIPVVGTNDSHYLEAPHARAHEALLCIQTGSTIKDPNRWRFSSDEFYLKSAEEMSRVFSDLPEAHRNTLAVAERCNLELTFGQFHLPTYPIPSGYTSETYLDHLAREGCRRLYGGSPSDAVSERLVQELDVIKKMGFAGYFLVVWDFITYAKGRGIAVGPGRGSAAGSLVAYSLGITNIDPIRYGLLFERFLNPERVTMPDMDIDFSDDRRDEVIEYVARRYGRDNVAQIITFGTLGAKAVIRDVGRALGMPYNDVDRIAKLVPNSLNITLDAALEASPALAEAVRSRPEVSDLWDIAKTLEGLTRHASTHAAGVVISDQPLIEHIPLYKGGRGEVTTQYAMGPIEKIGLLKMDFLGLRTLTVIANTLALVTQSKGIALDHERIPLDDPDTYRLLSEANTSGVFQLESPGMREALRKLRPERLEDVIAIVALYRPGPMDLIADFINRKHGKAKITYEHPLMEKHLKETYGIMVYQEQVMQIAGEMAGFSMGEADILRRAMGKKDREMMATQRVKFIAGCKANRIDERKAERVFDLMEKFAGYGFNKSHAAAYAVVACHTAYLKANHPVEFMAALLTSEMGDTDRIVKYIEECRAMGVPVLPPDVNLSNIQFTVVGETIRFGLAAIKNVGEAAIRSILKTREENGPISSLADFCRRVDLRLLNRRVIESLIKAGAFDSLGAKRAQLLAGLDSAIENGHRCQRDRQEGQASFFDLMRDAPAAADGDAPLPAVAEWDTDQVLAYEKDVLGFYLSGHPLARFRRFAETLGATPIGALDAKSDGARVILFGQVTALKEITTKSGDRMAFATIEDMDGSVEITIFPEPFKASASALRSARPILVRGRVDGADEGKKVLAEEIRLLDVMDGGTANGAAVGAGTPSPVSSSGVPSDGPPEPTAQTCRVRVPAGGDYRALLGALRRHCGEHQGRVPLFLHLVLAGREVVIRASACPVQPAPALLEKVESLLGQGSIVVEYDRRPRV